MSRERVGVGPECRENVPWADKHADLKPFMRAYEVASVVAVSGKLFAVLNVGRAIKLLPITEALRTLGVLGF